MSFGSELKDQVSTVNQFLQGGIQFLTDFRDFMKERAQIEKDYAHKLEALAKKYSNRKDKKIVSLSVGQAVGSQPQTEPKDPTETSTFMKAWTVLLQEIENIAKDRSAFSETLSTAVIDQIKTVASKKEESRKKHMDFAQKLTSDRDKIYQGRQKAKSRYDESCNEAQQPQQSAREIEDMNNNKNLYILSIRIANEQKRKYYHTDVPALLDHMQTLNESRVDAVKKIWDDYVEHESSALTDVERHLEVIRQALSEVDSRVDSQLFIEHNKKEWDDPSDFVFESSQAEENTEELINDENSQVFLSNRLIKARNKLNDVGPEIDSKKREVTGMESLIGAYSNNPSLGDADAVTENMLETLREITVLETIRKTYQTEVDSITEAIGDITSELQPHEFKSTAFTIARTCDLCQKPIWGIGRQGLTCKECGYNCHADCEMKVPPICTRKKGVINSTVSEIFSNPTSPYNTLPNNMSYLISSAPTSNESSSSIADQEDHLKATALYDHIARSPSELSINEGDLITVLEPDDGDGWVKARLGEKEGLVPASYIKIETSDLVRAIYDYDAQTVEQLSIRENDIIEVTRRDPDGWWEGILCGKMGIFPGDYVVSWSS